MNRTTYILTIIILSIVSVAARPIVANQNYSKTMADVKAFLAADNTESYTWTDMFNCVKFTRILIKRARVAGFDAEPVIVVWTTRDSDGYQAHEFVAISTVDAGIVWVEPQDDGIYTIPSGGLVNFRRMAANTPLCEADGSYCWDGKVSYFYTYNTFNLWGYPSP